MKSVTLCDMPVRVDDQGMISLTDMWKAGGSKTEKKPALYGRSVAQQEFLNEMEKVHQCTFKKTVGRGGGVWGHKYVAYDYAAWIDPRFKIGVYSVLDKFFSGELVLPKQALHDHVLKVKLSEQLGSFHGKGLNCRRWEKQELEQEGLRLLHKYQQQLNFSPKALLRN